MHKMSILVGVCLLTFSLLYSSCNSRKNTQTSNQAIKDTKIKNDNLNEINDASGDVTINKNSTIKQNFLNQHTDANDVVWKEYNSDNSVINYEVSYIEHDKKSSIIYDYKGITIEERHEILVDQLPQQIHNEIQKSYPDYKIIDATTYKHINKEGSYIVNIQSITNANSTKSELIFNDNGSIVK